MHNYVSIYSNVQDCITSAEVNSTILGIYQNYVIYLGT